MSTRPIPHKQPDLTFRGLDRCDGCGVALAPAEQLWGLCEGCLSGDTKEPTREGDRHEP